MQLKSLCLGRQLFVANAINASFVELFYLLDCHHWINLRNPISLDHLKTRYLFLVESPLCHLYGYQKSFLFMQVIT
jgi:hypothetical protein